MLTLHFLNYSLIHEPHLELYLGWVLVAYHSLDPGHYLCETRRLVLLKFLGLAGLLENYIKRWKNYAICIFISWNLEAQVSRCCVLHRYVSPIWLADLLRHTQLTLQVADSSIEQMSGCNLKYLHSLPSDFHCYQANCVQFLVLVRLGQSKGKK